MTAGHAAFFCDCIVLLPDTGARGSAGWKHLLFAADRKKDGTTGTDGGVGPFRHIVPTTRLPLPQGGLGTSDQPFGRTERCARPRSVVEHPLLLVHAVRAGKRARKAVARRITDTRGVLQDALRRSEDRMHLPVLRQMLSRLGEQPRGTGCRCPTAIGCPMLASYLARDLPSFAMGPGVHERWPVHCRLVFDDLAAAVGIPRHILRLEQRFANVLDRMVAVGLPVSRAGAPDSTASQQGRRLVAEGVGGRFHNRGYGVTLTGRPVEVGLGVLQHKHRHLVAVPPGVRLVSVDFRSIEFRMLQHLFLSLPRPREVNTPDWWHDCDADPHATHARRWGVPRDAAKRGLFRILYGGALEEDPVIATARYRTTLLRDLHLYLRIGRAVARAGVYQGPSATRRVRGGLLDGRPLPPGVPPRNVLHTLLQGAASVVVKVFAVFLEALLSPEEGISNSCSLVNLVVDELLLECHHHPGATRAALHATRRFLGLRVPLAVSLRTGGTWDRMTRVGTVSASV